MQRINNLFIYYLWLAWVHGLPPVFVKSQGKPGQAEDRKRREMGAAENVDRKQKFHLVEQIRARQRRYASIIKFLSYYHACRPLRGRVHLSCTHHAQNQGHQVEWRGHGHFLQPTLVWWELEQI
jgi:hypothetical protein